MKLVFVFMFATLLPTYAEWSPLKTALNQRRGEPQNFDGVIKTIYTNETSSRMTLRVKSLDNRESEEFVICDEEIQGEETEKVQAVRQAFATGTPVRLGFTGSFERCLSSIKTLKEALPQQVGI